MKLSRRIAAGLYKTAKQHPQIRKGLLAAWRWASHVRARVLSGVARETFNAPLRATDSTKEWINGGNPTGLSYVELFESHLVRRRPPRAPTNTHWKFPRDLQVELPAAFVAEIPRGRVVGEGFVVAPPDILLGDVSPAVVGSRYLPSTKGHPALSMGRLPPPLRVRGTAVVAAVTAGRGYYHWMAEVLPRLQLAREAKLASIEDETKYIINSSVAAFHRESLQTLAISEDLIIETMWHPHISADQLIVPSFPGRPGHIPQWACDFLRSIFLDNSRVTPHRRRRLYISRRNATHRRVENEDELTDFLADQEIEIVTLEGISIRSQAKLFRSAELIVAPHGAGLTNVVFCNPGTKVLEIFSPNSVGTLFWRLANQVGLEYSYLLGEGEEPPELVDPERNEENIIVDPEKLVGRIELVCSSPTS